MQMYITWMEGAYDMPYKNPYFFVTTEPNWMGFSLVLHPNFRTELKIREFAYSKRILPNPNFVARFGRIRRFGRFMNYSIQMLKIRHYFTGTLQYCHARKYQIQSMHLTLDSCMPAWKPRLFIIINCKSNVDPRSRRCVAFKIQLSH